MVIRNQNIRDGKLELSDPSFTDEKHFIERTRRAIPTFGDLVITREAPMGLVCMIPQGLKCCLGQRMVLLRPNQDTVESRYLVYCMQGAAIQHAISVGGGAGSTVSNLRIPVLKSLRIPVPKLLEQRAIAAALSDVDALLAKLDQFIAKKRDLKQAAIQQLLTGQTRLPGFSGAWEVKRLGDVLKEIGDGATPSTANIANFGGNIPWVVIDDIRDEIWSTRNTLTENGLMSCAAHLWPPGTLILSTGATIGEVGIAKVSLATKQGICGLRFDPDVAHPLFMKYWFAKNKQLLLSKAQGSSIKEVRAPTLVQFPIHLPGSEEQTAVATVLSDMDAELAALEARRGKTRALKQGMMQELLTGRIRLV